MADNSSPMGDYVEGLFADWQADTASVGPVWQRYFSGLHRESASPAAVVAEDARLRAQVGVLRLINAYRFLGHRRANLDPLARHPVPDIPELTRAHHGLEGLPGDWCWETGSLAGCEMATLETIEAHLQRVYCQTVGLEYMYLTSVDQKRWIQQRMEGDRVVPDAARQRALLAQLTAAETLERYLHTRFVGQKRFSLEGGESLIPCLQTLIHEARASGTEEIVIGMAHRGRLNVLVNSLGRLPQDLFKEFEGVHSNALSSGDVKYHQGFSSDVVTDAGVVHVTLAFNPSHLEFVNPVVEGSVRARQDRRGDRQGAQVLPVLIHGDAALSGQGIVMETLALSQTRGFSTGGTVHVVINNQIGFTTSDPRDARSTLYCTDIAKMSEIPVFHVNGDDPEAVWRVTRVALDYRNTFHRDVMVDIVCYRRLGHNEQDEPMLTQPWMYRRIQAQPTTRQCYAKILAEQGVVSEAQAEAWVQEYRLALDQGQLPSHIVRHPDTPAPYLYATQWSRFRGVNWDTPADTTLTRERLQTLAARLTRIPEQFTLHPSLLKVVEQRRQMGEGTLPIDWGMAETLAYASLLEEGTSIRLSGQDCGRGTFSHRHAVWHDQNRQRWDAGTWIALEHMADKQGTFTVIDSILSEAAVLGFEYGYATAQPDCLVLWEAQFGDFANGAQVLIDQFISSGEAKWGRLCGLTLLLPHGYEGQGPEHSSARLERYLQLCAEYNIQVCIPSTAAQMFHLLRRQVRRPYRKPLMIITPKSLLRRKEVSSPREQFESGGFQTVIGEVAEIDPQQVSRILICSGRVYYDLLTQREQRALTDVAIVRLEQLYPFPHQEFEEQLKHYSHAHTVVWCQEEPGNQGAWHRIQHYLLRHMRPNQKLRYALRPSSAAPAVGYASLHEEQRRAFLDAAFAE